MLIKLLKYEFRSIGRQLIPLYLGVLVLALVNRFFWFTAPSSRGGMDQALGGVPAVLAGMAYFAVCVALAVITLLLILQRFYKGLLTEEGYLMFTLPCKPWQLITAKGLTASAMTLAACAVGILSLLLMFTTSRDWGFFFEGFARTWVDLFRMYAFWPLYMVEAFILIIVSLFSTIGHMYVSIAIGHLFKRHRIALAIVAYIGINMIWSAFLAIFVNILDSIHIDLPFMNLSAAASMHLSLLILIVWQLVPAVIYFFGTNWILSNKLNLE